MPSSPALISPPSRATSEQQDSRRKKTVDEEDESEEVVENEEEGDCAIVGYSFLYSNTTHSKLVAAL